MNLEKLKPWNWFKHEENAPASGQSIPVTRADNTPAADSLMSLHREMDRWFDNLSSAIGLPSLGADRAANGQSLAPFGGGYRALIDVSGDDNSYQIKLDVPGMTESDLSIEVRDDMLMIRGEKRHSSENKNKHYYRIERSYGAFQRTLALPDDADADEIAAKLDNGVLRLEIPRRESSGQNVRRIDIST
jgi:HSP20 family protein